MKRYVVKTEEGYTIHPTRKEAFRTAREEAEKIPPKDVEVVVEKMLLIIYNGEERLFYEYEEEKGQD